MFELNIFARRNRAKKPEFVTTADTALSILRDRARRYDQMLIALRVGCAPDDGVVMAIQAYCEDYGLEQVDPIRRIDVLQHALKAVEQRIELGGEGRVLSG